MYWWLRGHHAHGRRLSEAALDARPARRACAAGPSWPRPPCASRWTTSAPARAHWQAAARPRRRRPRRDGQRRRRHRPRRARRGRPRRGARQLFGARDGRRRRGRPGGRLDARPVADLARHGRAAEGDPDARRRRDRAGAGVRPAPRRPAVGVHRALQPLAGRADPRPARRGRGGTSRRGCGSPLETGDHANLAYLLDARGGARGGRGHPRAGAAPARRRAGDPRGASARSATATTGPTRGDRGRRGRGRAAARRATGTTTPSTSAAASARSEAAALALGERLRPADATRTPPVHLRTVRGVRASRPVRGWARGRTRAAPHEHRRTP